MLLFLWSIDKYLTSHQKGDTFQSFFFKTYRFFVGVLQQKCIQIQNSIQQLVFILGVLFILFLFYFYVLQDIYEDFFFLWNTGLVTPTHPLKFPLKPKEERVGKSPLKMLQRLVFSFISVFCTLVQIFFW